MEAEPEDHHLECERVGEPMPDIAGIGIIVAFAGQAAISLSLAIWVFFLSRHRRLEVQHEQGTAEHAVEVKRLESVLDILMVGNDIQMLTGIALMITAFAASTDIDLYHLHLIYDTVSFVGVSNAAALIVWTFCAAKHPDAATKYYRHNNNNHHHNYKHKHRHSNLTNSSQPNTSPNNNTNPNLKTTPETIPNPNPNSDPNPNSNLNPIPKFPHRRRRSRLLSRRHKTTYLFALLFLSLTLLLLIRLQQTWSTSPTAPLGSCYVATSLLASPGGSHPYIDKVYVAVTAAWLLVVLFVSVFMDVEATGRKRDGDSNDNGDGDEDERGDGGEGGGGDGSKKRRRRRDWKRKFVLLLAVAQFPVHLYAVVALRAGNQAALEGVSRNEGVVDGDGQGEEGEGEGENDWDFGQTTAVLLLLVTLHECFEKGVGLWRFERELKRSRDGDGDGDVDLESDAVGGRGGVLDGEGRVSRVER